MPPLTVDRRQALKLAAAALAAPWAAARASDEDDLMSRAIPGTGERLPVRREISAEAGALDRGGPR